MIDGELDLPAGFGRDHRQRAAGQVRVADIIGVVALVAQPGKRALRHAVDQVDGHLRVVGLARGLINKPSGQPWALVSAWSLVVKPPRERPRPWTRSPFLRRRRSDGARELSCCSIICRAAASGSASARPSEHDLPDPRQGPTPELAGAPNSKFRRTPPAGHATAPRRGRPRRSRPTCAGDRAEDVHPASGSQARNGSNIAHSSSLIRHRATSASFQEAVVNHAGHRL